MDRQKFSVLLTDLDDTVWNWFETWYVQFTTLMTGVCRISGVDFDKLKPEIREIHQRRGTSEYSFLLQEMPTLLNLYPGKNLREVFADAIQASREVRRSTLKLYPGVLETFDQLRSAGTLIIAYTDSQAYWTRYRLKKTDLDVRIDYLYSAPDHDLPKGLTIEQVRTMPPEYYTLRLTEHRHTPKGVLKPSPEVLLKILADVHAKPEDALYIGDSKMKDIAMAKQAGVFDVLVEHKRPEQEYNLLREITHWTDADVQREKEVEADLQGLDLSPRLEVLEFSELLAKFDFVAHTKT